MIKRLLRYFFYFSLIFLIIIGYIIFKNYIYLSNYFIIAKFPVTFKKINILNNKIIIKNICLNNNNYSIINIDKLIVSLKSYSEIQNINIINPKILIKNENDISFLMSLNKSEKSSDTTIPDVFPINIQNLNVLYKQDTEIIKLNNITLSYFKKYLNCTGQSEKLFKYLDNNIIKITAKLYNLNKVIFNFKSNDILVKKTVLNYKNPEINVKINNFKIKNYFKNAFFQNKNIDLNNIFIFYNLKTKKNDIELFCDKVITYKGFVFNKIFIKYNDSFKIKNKDILLTGKYKNNNLKADLIVKSKKFRDFIYKNVPKNEYIKSKDILLPLKVKLTTEIDTFYRGILNFNNKQINIKTNYFFNFFKKQVNLNNMIIDFDKMIFNLKFKIDFSNKLKIVSSGIAEKINITKILNFFKLKKYKTNLFVDKLNYKLNYNDSKLDMNLVINQNEKFDLKYDDKENSFSLDNIVVTPIKLKFLYDKKLKIFSDTMNIKSDLIKYNQFIFKNNSIDFKIINENNYLLKNLSLKLFESNILLNTDILLDKNFNVINTTKIKNLNIDKLIKLFDSKSEEYFRGNINTDFNLNFKKELDLNGVCNSNSDTIYLNKTILTKILDYIPEPTKSLLEKRFNKYKMFPFTFFEADYKTENNLINTYIKLSNPNEYIDLDFTINIPFSIINKFIDFPLIKILINKSKKMDY